MQPLIDIDAVLSPPCGMPGPLFGPFRILVANLRILDDAVAVKVATDELPALVLALENLLDTVV